MAWLLLDHPPAKGENREIDLWKQHITAHDPVEEGLERKCDTFLSRGMKARRSFSFMASPNSRRGK